MGDIAQKRVERYLQHLSLKEKIQVLNHLINRQTLLFEGEFEGKDQMYVKSVSENFDMKKINLSYFKENEFNDLKTALKSIEKILNLISNEPKLDFHVEDKPSILRSIVPFPIALANGLSKSEIPLY